MTQDQQLRELLKASAKRHEQDFPPAPADDLVRAGRKAQRRKRIIHVAMTSSAVVVLLAATWTALASPGSDQEIGTPLGPAPLETHSSTTPVSQVSLTDALSGPHGKQIGIALGLVPNTDPVIRGCQHFIEYSTEGGFCLDDLDASPTEIQAVINRYLPEPVSVVGPLSCPNGEGPGGRVQGNFWPDDNPEHRTLQQVVRDYVDGIPSETPLTPVIVTKSDDHASAAGLRTDGTTAAEVELANLGSGWKVMSYRACA